MDVKQLRTVVLAVLISAFSNLPIAAIAGTASRSGEKTVSEVCSNCHGAGLMGAPQIGDAGAWQARLKTAGSIDQLVESAEHGKGNMPPRGGMSNLSDDDLKAAIAYMLTVSGAAN